MAALARALAPIAEANVQLEELAAELAVRAAREAAPGLDDDELDSRADQANEVAQEMMNLKATSLTGLRSKAQAALWAAGGKEAWLTRCSEGPRSTYDQVVHSIVGDLVALPTADVHSFPGRPVEATSSASANDSELRRAAAEFIAFRAESDAQGARVRAAAEAASALYPDLPASIRNPQRPGQPLERIQLQQMDESAKRQTWPAPEGSPRVEAFDHWVAQIDAIDRSFGLLELDATWEKINDAEDAVADRVVALKPRTVQEAAIKYGVLLAAFGSSDREEITAPIVFFNFLADLEHLANPG